MRAYKRTIWTIGALGCVLVACGGSTADDGATVDGGDDASDAEALDGSGGGDSTVDAAHDAPADVAKDVAADVKEDVLQDAPLDVGIDVGADVAAEVEADGTADGGADVTVDVATDGSPDAGSDAADAGLQCVAETVRVVSHWRGDGDLTDAIGANGGYSAGAAAFTTGEVGQGISLTGAAGSFVQVPDSPTLALTGPLTVEGWVQTTGDGRILDKITANGADGYLLDVNGGKLRLFVGNDSVSSTAALPTGALVHVAGVYDGASLSVYVNGALAATKTTAVATIPVNTLPLHIGADSTGANRLTGLVDELRLYKGALGGSDIQAIYEAGARTACACVAASPRVVSWWRGEGDFADVFLNNNGASAGAAGFAAGEVGQGFSFTGATGSYVTAASSASLQITGPMTIDAWIDATALGGRIVDKITAGGTDGYLLDTVGNKLRLLVGNDSISSTATLATGVLTHVAGVYDGANLTVYVNGAVAGTKATAVAAVPTSTNALRIGADSSGASLFSGIIDEPRIFNGALSAGEIQAIYAAGTTARCGCASPWPGLVSWWRGDGNFTDSVGPNTGASAGAAGFAAGEVGQGFSLTGASTSYVTAASSASLQITGPMTIDAWIDATALGGRIVDKITAGGTDGYLLDTVGNKLRLLVGNDSISSTATLATGVLTHVAGVYDGANLTVYVNGAVAGTKATAVAAVPTSTNALRIGADSSGASLFNGVIDETRIFDRALSAAEIQSIFQEGGLARCR